jgi:hypothetical protein
MSTVVNCRSSTGTKAYSIDLHRAVGAVSSDISVHVQVLGILQQNDFEDARVAKMGQDDILRLLACFNAAGIHFA